VSRRRASYAPYRPVERETVYAAMYGEQQPADPRDLTVVPEIAEPDPWLDGLVAGVETVALGLAVIAIWNLGLALLASLL
jgi:hypothetical protein